MKKAFLVGFTFLVAAVAFGENTTTAVAPGSTEAVVAAPSEQKIIGMIDFRPSLDLKASENHTETILTGGYQFNKDFKATLNLYLDNNLYTRDASNSGFQSRQTGLYSQVNLGLWKDGDTSLGLTNRIYFPTDSSTRDQGQIFTTRNYFTLANKVSENLTLSISETPIFHVYNVAGTNGAANPWLENRIYAAADVTVGPVVLSPVLWWSARRYRQFLPTAKNDDTWTHRLELDVDLLYNINPNFAVGVGYYSENMLGTTPKGGIDGIHIGDGLSNGVPQLILDAQL